MIGQKGEKSGADGHKHRLHEHGSEANVNRVGDGLQLDLRAIKVI